eukprot:TRINITY_DN33356_c0_g1_i1.p1 TRINITY_DN33356_c0_g1~~TRINITY_DN33356_c0_g1_i1.p1  ORF type:complete len:346 (+),score=100.10 TRINITY_DN33356_c0_g1_i1:89-1039(+)
MASFAPSAADVDAAEANEQAALSQAEQGAGEEVPAAAAVEVPSEAAQSEMEAAAAAPEAVSQEAAAAQEAPVAPEPEAPAAVPPAPESPAVAVPTAESPTAAIPTAESPAEAPAVAAPTAVAAASSSLASAEVESAAEVKEKLPQDDHVLREHLRALLKGQDVNTLSMKGLRGLLAIRLDLDPSVVHAEKERLKHLVEPLVVEMNAPAPSASTPPPKGPAMSNALSPSAPSAVQPPRQDARKRQATAMTRTEFLKRARSIPVTFGDRDYIAHPRTFSTGSCGYMVQQKVAVNVGGEELTMQLNLNCTIIGSKAWQQ